MVDIVTNRQANMHDELLQHIGTADPLWGTLLYTTAYRSVEQEGESALDIWQQELQLARSLPTMPLWLRGGICLPIDLNTIRVKFMSCSSG